MGEGGIPGFTDEAGGDGASAQAGALNAITYAVWPLFRFF